MICVSEKKTGPACQVGDFPFAAAHLDHAHIYSQCAGLVAAGGSLRWVYDPDPAKTDAFRARFPQAQPARSLKHILDDPTVKLVAAAAIPGFRCSLGCQVMEAGKDYFTDKTPFISLEQLATARKAVASTGRKYIVYYGERVHVECAVMAGQLIQQDAIGRVIQTVGFGPHRLGRKARPGWFFDKASCGGILCDIGSHQSEQFLYYTGASEAQVRQARVANFTCPDMTGFEDFGEATLAGDNGASGYYRVDWLTPDGLSTWGDVRTFIYGVKGYIELRKNLNLGGVPAMGNQLFLVDEKGEHHISCEGQVGYPFFGELILDCLNRTENAMTQSHAFKAAELSLLAQRLADQG